MKVWFIGSSLPHNGLNASGGDISNFNLLKKLSSKNDIHVYSINNLKKHQNNFFQINSEKQELNNSKIISFFNKFLLLPIKFIFNFSSKPNLVILTRGGIIYSSIFKILYSNCKIYIIVRAFEDLNYFDRDIILPKKSIFRKIDFWISYLPVLRGFKISDRIIVNSEFMKNTILKILNVSDKKILVLYPKTFLNNKNPNFDKVKNLGFINKGLHKGSELILELANELKNLNFLVFGENLMNNSSNISNLGYFTKREEIYDKIDILLVPSIWPEPYGRVAAECLLLGKPCIVHDIGGLGEAAVLNTFSLRSLDVKSWKYKIKFLSENKKEVNMSILEAQKELIKREASETECF